MLQSSIIDFKLMIVPVTHIFPYKSICVPSYGPNIISITHVNQYLES